MIRRVSVDQADAVFGPSGDREELSVAHGCAALVVDGDRGPERSPPDVPCVLIAAGTGDGWDGFDVRVTDDTPLGPVAAGVEANPLASVALVQLLRLAPLHPDAALWAESVTYGLLQGGPEFGAWAAAHPPRPVQRPAHPVIHVEGEGDHLDIVLAHPEVRNAVDRVMRDALVEALDAVAADPGIRQVVLRGEGPDFSSGGHLGEFGTFPDPVTAHAIRSTRLPARAAIAVRDRLRAEVHGSCVGAGVELAACAAHVAAAPGSTFTLPEVGMGLIPGSGGTWSVPRRVGYQRAAWLALSGTSIDAVTALNWGLVDEITERAEEDP